MEFLHLAVAVFVGGMIPIVLFFLEKWWERRSRVQDWFVEKYIENGIDVLHQFFRQWAMLSSLPARSPRELLSERAFAELPHQAVARLSPIAGDVVFQNWFNAMRALWLRATHQNDFNRASKFHVQGASMAEHLNTLRQGLLQHRLRSRAGVYRLRSSDCVARFNELLKKMTDDLVDDPDTKRYGNTDGGGH